MKNYCEVKMTKTDLLFKRLDEIAQSLKNSGAGLALIGLGSVGIETDRIDEYSDLDFFAVVKDGYKGRFIEDLSWLSSICEVAYNFRNTRDGHKLLFKDGVFCEFAVFELNELSNIPYSEGRIIWKEDYIDENIKTPVKTYPQKNISDSNWLIGEALTNLYVGLCRERRGEKLSAFQFIQNYAVAKVVELCETIEPEISFFKDGFVLERRFEKRFPETSQYLSSFIQGYDKNKESALFILNYLDLNFKVNNAMKELITKLCE